MCNMNRILLTSFYVIFSLTLTLTSTKVSVGDPSPKPIPGKITHSPYPAPSSKDWDPSSILKPSTRPSPRPSTRPSPRPSSFPSSWPSSFPSAFPSSWPSSFPSAFPSPYPDNSKHEAAKEIMRHMDCIWINGLNEHDQWVSQVSAYPVQNCGKKGTKVCTGTAMCHVKLQSSIPNSAVTIYLENVMCTTSGNKCKTASDCVREGGILEDVGIDVVQQAPAGVNVFKPTQSAVGAE